MAEDLSLWQHGAVQFPVTDSTDNSLLEDVDPALHTMLALLSAAIHADVGARLRNEAALHDMTINNAVAQTIHVEPTPFLYADQLTFPTLAVYRKSEEYSDKTSTFENDVAEWEFAYILPALSPHEVQRIQPILRAVAQSIRRAVRDGFHAAYESGAVVWGDAGVAKARVVSARYGGYDPIAEVAKYYRAIVGTMIVSERGVLHTGTFEDMAGVNAAIDVEDPVDETTVADFVEVETYPAPTLTSISPTTGTKAGGTTITITGTNFRTGTLPRVWIGGIEATAVNVTSTTTVTCVSPAHDAYTTFAADLVFEAIDGQTDELTEAFTFTTP